MASKETCILHGKELREVQDSLIRIETILAEMAEYRKSREEKEKEVTETIQDISTRLTVIETEKRATVFFAGIVGGIISFIASRFWH